jgi:hypothetical protein
VRIVLGEPQRCGTDARPPTVMVEFTEVGEGLLSTLYLAETYLVFPSFAVSGGFGLPG